MTTATELTDRLSGRLQAYQLVGAGLFVFFTALALYWPIDLSGDEWTYHFPFAAKLWGIAPGTFQLPVEIEPRWVGFPKLWEWVQGLFWVATGSLRGAMIPTFALTGLYWWIASTRLRVPTALLVIGFFMCPMLMVHYQIFYADLPTGLLLASAAILLVTTDFARSRLLSWDCAMPALLLGAAGNIKVQGLIGSAAIATVIVVVRIARTGMARGFSRLLTVLAIGLAIASLSYVSTYARTGNPLYPFELKFGDQAVLEGPEHPLAQLEAAPPAYDIRHSRYAVPQPVAFFLSVTELDWVLRGVAPRYNADSNSGDTPISGSPSRTGGWGQLFVMLNLGLLLVQLARLRREQDLFEQQLLLSTVGLLLLIAFVPRSHELRYWLFLPLLMIPVNLRYLRTLATPNRLGLLMIAPLALSLAQVALSPNSYVLSRPAFVGMRGGPERSAEMERSLRTTGRYCLSGEYPLFRYSQAVTGQSGFLSGRLSDCSTANQKRVSDSVPQRTSPTS